MPLKIIDNFTGRLTRDNIGDMNSGYAKYATTFGNDPFTNVGALTWLEAPVAINNPDGSGNTSVCMAAKVRLETQTTYVYAIFDNKKLSKIQVNDTVSKNPDYDTATLLTTISNGTPSFFMGGSMQFYGATEKIFLGHDVGVTKVNFDGSGETVITGPGGFTASVPRPMAAFLGKLYVGNGNNIAEIDSTELVTTFTKLSPGFPVGTFVRDLDVSPDGNYLQITVARNNAPNQTQVSYGSIQLDTKAGASSDSYKFLWNGTDTNYTSFETYNGYSLTSNTVFGSYSYMLGNDSAGTALYEGNKKIESLPLLTSPNFGAAFSSGNLLGFASTEYADSVLKSAIFFYGQYDNEVPKGLFRFLRLAPSTGTDTLYFPTCLTVSNLTYGPSISGYTNNKTGSGKLYFSVVELDATPTSTYKFYRFATSPTGSGTAIGGVYETQQETSLKLFRSVVSKKFKPNSVRFYTEPLVANNSFKIDIIGSDGNPMSGGSQTFTVGSNVTAGQDYVWYTPATASTYSMGFRITNLGSVNWVGLKLEVDYEESGV